MFRSKYLGGNCFRVVVDIGFFWRGNMEGYWGLEFLEGSRVRVSLASWVEIRGFRFYSRVGLGSGFI